MHYAKRRSPGPRTKRSRLNLQSGARTKKRQPIAGRGITAEAARASDCNRGLNLASMLDVEVVQRRAASVGKADYITHGTTLLPSAQ